MNKRTYILKVLFGLSFIALPFLAMAQFTTVGPFTECVSSPDVIDFDRNDFGGTLSEGYLHNISVPPETSCGTSVITSAIVEISINSIDFSGLTPPCNFISAFGNVLIDAGNIPFGAGCCSISQDILSPGCGSFGMGTMSPTTESLDIVIDCGEFVPMGGTIGVDIIAAINGDASCPSNPVSDGSIVIDYTICVTFEVAVPQEPTVDAGPDITINCVTPGLIGADPVAPDFVDGWTYEWSDMQNGTFSSSDNGQVNVMPTMTEIYTVTVTGSGGCTDEDEVEVVFDCCPDPGCDDMCALTMDTWDDVTCMCIFDPPICDDGCPDTDDMFDSALCDCVFTPNVVCDDGCPDTDDMFDSALCDCVFIPNVVCDDGCPDTDDIFDSVLCNCVFTPIVVCDDGCPDTDDMFNAVLCDCVFTPAIICDDSCPETTDVFDAILCDCVFVPPTCDDGCPDTDDIFNDVFCECEYIENVICDDGCPDTDDVFDSSLCDCVFTPNVLCDDGCSDTDDMFDAVLCDCVFTLNVVCDDGCPDTDDMFDSALCDCVFEYPDCNDMCDMTNDFYDEILCLCMNEEPDCNDNDCSTIDSFDDNACECVNETNVVCDDDCDLTTDTYDTNLCECVFTPPNIDDGCPETMDVFVESTCEVLHLFPDCDDNDCSTIDTFDEDNCMCVNDPNVNCDDGCALTTDTYDSVLCDCIFTAPDVDDGCAETIDSFDEVTCTIVNEPPSCDDGCDLTMDSFDFDTCACANEEPDCDDGIPGNGIEIFDEALCDCTLGNVVVSPPIVQNILWCEGDAIATFNAIVANFHSIEWYDSIGGSVLSTDLDWIPPGPGVYFAIAINNDGTESVPTMVEAFEVPYPTWSNVDYICDPIAGTYSVFIEFDNPAETSFSDFNGITFESTNGGFEFVMNQGEDMLATFAIMSVCMVDFSFPEPDCDCQKLASVNDQAFLPCDGSDLILENEYTGPMAAPPSDVYWEDINGDIISDTSFVEVSEVGEYVIVSYDAAGDCFLYDTIAVFEAPMVELMVDTSGGLSFDCAVSSITLEVTNPVENVFYSWTQGLDGEQALSFTTSDVGPVYLLGVDTITMCSTIDTFEIEDITAFPEINFEPVTSIDCDNPIITIDASNSESGPNFSHQWYDGSGMPINGETDLTLTGVDAGGMYIFESFNDDNSCSNQDTIMVEDFSDFPSVNAGDDLILDCDMISLDLDGSSGTDAGANFEYLWISIEGNTIDNEADLVPTIYDEGSYVLQVTNTDNGCVETDTIDVDLEELSGITFELTDPDCLDLSGGVIEVFSQNSNGFTYTLDTETNDMGIFEGLSSGSYNLMIETTIGCSLDTVLTLNEPDLIDLQLAQNEFLVLEEENIRLDLLVNRDESEIADISISPILTSSCDDCFDPLLSDFDAGVYELILTDLNGCMDTVEFEISLRVLFSVYTPNVFNKDEGGNFTIFSKDPININSMSIFDRWGNQVFNLENFPTNDPSFGWDGRMQDQDVTQGVYILRIEYEDDQGELQYIFDDITVLGN